jgi:hypothetical protein
MPDCVESLQDIEKDRCAVFISFHIIVYSFNNSMYLLYDCVFISETKLMIEYQPDFPLLWESLGIEVFQIVSIGQIIND